MCHGIAATVAYSLLAWNYVNLGWATMEAIHPLEARAMALPAIKKSIELDPGLSDSYLILGSLNFFLEWDMKETDRNFTKAMKIRQWYDRPTPYCFCGYSHFLIYNRRFDDVVELVEKIETIDPAYVYGNADLGSVYYFTNRLDEAVSSVKQTIIGSNGNIYWYQLLGRIYIQKGEYQTAIDTLENGLAKTNLRPALALAYLSDAYYKAGRQEESQAIIRDLENRLPPNDIDVSYSLAYLAASRGDYENALGHLEKAYKKHDWSFFKVNLEPYFKPLYDHPGFQNLLKQMDFQYTEVPLLKD